MKDLDALRAHILDRVRLEDLLRQEGLIHGAMDEEQLSCPFHGADNKKSARYYRETDSMYCWVCRIRWDLFGYYAQKSGTSFSETLRNIISEYRIDTSSIPERSVVLSSSRRKTETAPTVSQKVLYVEKLHSCLETLRGRIAPHKYAALVFSYMIIKYATSDERLPEHAEAVNAALLRVSKGLA